MDLLIILNTEKIDLSKFKDEIEFVEEALFRIVFPIKDFFIALGLTYLFYYQASKRLKLSNLSNKKKHVFSNEINETRNSIDSVGT